MLPPVSPVSATDVSFSMAKPPQDTASTLPAPPPVAQGTTSESAKLASGTGIRAVSGELQLSSNVSVLAETLGKLLNIERMDGEGAEAYVNRLVEIIKTLPMDQKGALEKALGSVLRGITLDMLSTALKSSAGPEAARLAVMFELSRSSGTGRTAKPSIPAYLQDILPDSPVIPQIKTLATTPAAVANKMPAPQVALATYLLGEIGPDPSVTPSSTTAQPAKSGAIVAPSNVPTAPTGTLPTPINAAAAQGQLPHDGQSVLQPTQQPNAKPAPTGLNEPALATRPPMTEQQRTALIAQQAPSPVEVTAENERPTPIPVANIAECQPNLPTGGAFSKATPKEMEKLLLAVVLGKLPEQAETITPQIVASLLTEQDPQHISKPLLAAKSDLHTGSVDQTAEDTVLAAQRQETLAAQRNAVAEDIKAALLEQPTLHSALAAIVGKEAIPLPYVPYPAAKDEEESDAPPRGSMHSSQGDSEDANDGSEKDENDPPQEERIAANDVLTDQSLSQGENKDGATDNAESYYLRMSGYS
ncbi:hypothetical protein RHIZ_14865 [Rhizobium skierniewicense]|uniref:hypothetical protein n=1 Tax=Rhizobium skierniewicense TaxID=984260 RepID=UPI001FAC35B2|nr:hypothetical protein [Rhizobium skierniewicense]MCI9867234.1 hypothetical protein [Rhizobium skierniewicense]